MEKFNSVTHYVCRENLTEVFDYIDYLETEVINKVVLIEVDLDYLQTKLIDLKYRIKHATMFLNYIQKVKYRQKFDKEVQDLTRQIEDKKRELARAKLNSKKAEVKIEQLLDAINIVSMEEELF